MSHRNLIPVALILCAGIAAFTFYGFRSQSVSPADSAVSTEEIMETIKQSESQRPAGISNSPTEDEIYSNPYILHIRTALNGYLDGTNNGIEAGEMNAIVKEDNCGLDGFNRSYYKSKFIVASAEKSDYGGVQAHIVFIDKPDTMFWAWVYKYVGGEYVLRAFCTDEIRPELQEEFPKTVQKWITDSRHSL